MEVKCQPILTNTVTNYILQVTALAIKISRVSKNDCNIEKSSQALKNSSDGCSSVSIKNSDL